MLSLLSCGSNAQGQLGNGTRDDSQRFLPCSFADHSPGSLPPGTKTILKVATGANHTMVLLELSGGDKEIWGCGDGRKGQLGSAYQQNASATTFQKLDLSLELSGQEQHSFEIIGATWETSYVVLSCGGGGPDMVLAMGSNEFGDLGAGTLKGKTKFNNIFLEDITGMYTGQRHIVLRLGTSKLIGWGSSRHGQLGDTASKPVASFPSMISLPSIIEDPIRSISLGMQHTVILFESGRLYSLGSNRKHQLDVVGAPLCHVLSLACTWNGTYVAFKDDHKEGSWEVCSSGNNSHSQLGRSVDESTIGGVSFPSSLDTQNSAVSIHCGSEHVLALVEDCEIWGWGWNEHGNLGVGHTDDVPLPTKIWPPEGPAHSHSFKVHGSWGGLGTSWICVEMPDEDGKSKAL
ncbi:hypothetical protein D9619_006616 [Psilocybe cf. subviscida]|uniref:Uncharacterized protein n=1 Tax=Psilocybe cf. subviscida TaxID=2480587 RepID=A0A8H5B4V6_9AGAR|nr:hypothetical protein D9619_006616 [Psilocybe cf. subviscida]